MLATLKSLAVLQAPVSPLRRFTPQFLGHNEHFSINFGAVTSRRRAFLFPRSARIASRRRFEELYASDTKRVGRYLVAWHAPSESASHRLGVTAAKRTFRDAHERNRAKRLMREAFRRLRPSFAGGPWDLVLVAKRRILEAKEPEVRADLEKVCRAAGLLPGSRP